MIFSSIDPRIAPHFIASADRLTKPENKIYNKSRQELQIEALALQSFKNNRKRSIFSVIGIGVGISCAFTAVILCQFNPRWVTITLATTGSFLVGIGLIKVCLQRRYLSLANQYIEKAKPKEAIMAIGQGIDIQGFDIFDIDNQALNKAGKELFDKACQNKQIPVVLYLHKLDPTIYSIWDKKWQFDRSGWDTLDAELLRVILRTFDKEKNERFLESIADTAIDKIDTRPDLLEIVIAEVKQRELDIYTFKPLTRGPYRFSLVQHCLFSINGHTKEYTKRSIGHNLISILDKPSYGMVSKSLFDMGLKDASLKNKD
jgi:hypothetical protein